MLFNKLTFLFFLLFECIGEEPQKICHPSTPFKKQDQTCGSFNDICVKTDNEDCEYFKKACQQCPPSNYSVLMLINILDMKSQMKNTSSKLEWIKYQLNNLIPRINGLINNFAGYLNETKKESSEKRILTACLIFILMILILNIIIVSWKSGKLKKVVAKLRKKRQDEEETEALVSNEQINNLNENFQRITKENKEMLTQITQRINEKGFSVLDSVVSYKLRFQIANQFDETELFVSKFDSVIKLKKSICDGNMNDYKSMIMKYKGVTLDNNQYLLSCIDSTNISPIFCEFDDNIDVDAMIVIKLKCDNIYPEMLQIWKYQTIKHLKIIISKLNKTNHEDLLIFYKSNQLYDDNKSIDYYKIEDNDWINVVNKSHMNEMVNIDETIEYSNLKIVNGRNKCSKNVQIENLQIFQITKSHPRFFQLIDICMDNSWIYIGLDIFREITLKTILPYIKKNETTFEISKWASQILEGLKHLGPYNIILKDMNPIDIWIDGSHDVKLPNFNMTEYLWLLDKDKYKYEDGILAYFAPEIFECKSHEAIADVWSPDNIMIKSSEEWSIFSWKQ